MNRKMWTKAAGFLVLITLLCIVLPFICNEWYLSIVIFLFINLILAVSFRLITTTGLFSFAHISLMGVGAYTSGMLVTRLGFSFWLSLPLAILNTVLFAVLIGLPTLRTKGFQFFITSYAAGQAIWWVWIIFYKPFGSYEGIGFVPPPNSFLGIDFSNPISYYFIVLIFALSSLMIMYRLEQSRIGVTAKAISSNDSLCLSTGINCYRHKLKIFVIASAFAGLAGVLLCHYTATACPNDYLYAYNLNILIFVLTGGLASFAGPIIGTIAMTILGEVLRDLLEYLPLIYGAILIMVVLFLPGGLTSLPGRVSPWFKKKFRGSDVEETSS